MSSRSGGLGANAITQMRRSFEPDNTPDKDYGTGAAPDLESGSANRVRSKEHMGIVAG